MGGGGGQTKGGYASDSTRYYKFSEIWAKKHLISP